MKKIFSYILFLSFFLNSYSQDLKNETFNLILKNLDCITLNREIVVYEWNEKIYIVIVKIDTVKFAEFKFEKVNNILTLKDITSLTNNNCLNKVFDYKNLSKEYIDYQSEFYKNKNIDYNGTTIYFAMKTSNGGIYGECRLTTIVNKLPYDKDIFWFLLSRINDEKIMHLECSD